MTSGMISSAIVGATPESPECSLARRSQLAPNEQEHWSQPKPLHSPQLRTLSLHGWGMQPRMVRIVIPAPGIIGNVSADRIKFLVVPDNPLVVVSLPKRPYRGQVTRSDLAADRALETANCCSQRSRLRSREQVGARPAGHTGARQHDDAVQMVGHHHPDVDC